MKNLKKKVSKSLLYNLCFLIFASLIVLSSYKDSLGLDDFYNGFRFKVKISLSMDIDSNQRLNKKEYGEDNTTLYEISGLLSKNIVIKVFKDNKIISSNTLYLINKTNDGDIYLYEQTAAGFINLWTIFPKMNMVICNKQYISITPLKTKNIELRQYINHIESSF